jgi:cell division inhibitor SepF
MGMLKNALGFLGLSGGSTAPEAPVKAVANKPQRVTQLMPRRGAVETSEIYTVLANSYEDSLEIAARYRDGVSVIVNMGAMSEAECKRLVDFLCGLKEGLEGNLRRVTPKVFLITPNHVGVNEEEDGQGGDDLLVRP